MQFSLKCQCQNYTSFLETMKTDYLTSFQFTTGLNIYREWLNKYSLSIKDIATHNKLDPKRKQDPGSGFPLNEFISTL